MDTSEMIRLLCRKYRISMAELARRIGQSSQNLSQKIKRGTLNMDEMAQIAAAVGAEYSQNFEMQENDTISMRVKNTGETVVSDGAVRPKSPDFFLAKKMMVSLFALHLDEDRIDVIFAPEEIKRKYRFGASYTEVMTEWLEKGIVEKDREKIAWMVNRKNLIDELQKRERISIVFCSTLFHGKKYMESVVVKAGKNNEAYLAIVDRDEEITRQIESEKKNREVSFTDSVLFSAVSEMFERMFICNLTKNVYHEVKMLDASAGYNNIDGTYNEFLNVTSASLADPAEKKRFKSFFDRDNLIRCYERHEYRLSYFCEVMTSDCIKKDIDIRCLLKKDPEGDIVAITMANNITDENEKIRRIDILQDRERNKNELIGTLTKDFVSVYKVNLDEDTYEIIKMNERSMEAQKLFSQSGKRFTDNSRRWISQFVHADDKDALLETIQLKVLRKHLDEKGSIEMVFRDCAFGYPQYFRMIAAKHETVEPGNWAIFVFINANESVREEIDNQNALKNALKQANVAVEAKRKFLFSMSHDIRTPLNAIIGFSQVAMLSNNLTTKMRECLEKIKESGDSLMHMLNDVLEMSNLESGDICVEESMVEKADIGRNVISMIQQAAFMKNIRFSYSVINLTEGMVWCDLNKVNQILISLLTNAVNFTPEGGNIVYTIEQISVFDPEYESFCFKVKDSGIGISNEFIGSVFDPFSKEKTSTDSRVDGSGLGLSIALRLAEMMNAKINVESEKGKGSTFSLNISFRRASGNDDGKVRKAKNHKLKGHNVLVADNDRLNTGILSKMFLNMGMIADITENEEDTLDKVCKAEKDFYSVILVNCEMSGKPVEEMISTIKKSIRKKNSRTQLIVMSQTDMSSDIIKFFEAGADEFISKPINIGNLKNILGKMID